MLFVIVVLTSLRVTRMFTRDTIFEAQRHAWWRRFPPKDEDKRQAAKCRTKEHKLGMLIECPWCIGFWVSGLVVLVTEQVANVPLPLYWWLAVSAAQALIHGYEK